jgi:hypothetical protein
MSGMNRVRGLIALNAALLLALGVVTFAPSSLAQQRTTTTGGGNSAAQAAAGGRARGEYTMVAGRIVGGSGHAVYVFDANNQEMVTMMWNQSSRAMDVIGYRDLRADASAQPVR